MGRRSKAKVPANRGEFSAGHARVSTARIDLDLEAASRPAPTVEITSVRDSDFPATDVTDVHWKDMTFDLSELTNLWVFVGHFSKKVRGVAHTELGFEFSDNRNVVASFEIRPLKGQRYSILKGAQKNFELALRWCTERDAMLRRFNRSKIDTEMYMFEADITHARIIELFLAAARRTNELADEAEWYHSLTNTCTTNIFELVNEILPGHLRTTPHVLLPGWLPKLWAKQGVIKITGSFEETVASSYINDQCMEIGVVEDFSARLHGRV